MKNEFEYVGSMFFDNEIDISDPCYTRDGNCNIIDYKIKGGKYNCFIKFGLEEDYSENRIAEIMIVKYNYFPETRWEKVGIIGVDSGLAGFFNHKIEYDNNGWSELCNRLALKEDKKCWINFDNGFFSESGWGDGAYSVYEIRNNDKQTIALKIVFIEYKENNEE